MANLTKTRKTLLAINLPLSLSVILCGMVLVGIEFYQRDEINLILLFITIFSIVLAILQEAFAAESFWHFYGLIGLFRMNVTSISLALIFEFISETLEVVYIVFEVLNLLNCFIVFVYCFMVCCRFYILLLILLFILFILFDFLLSFGPF